MRSSRSSRFSIVRRMMPTASKLALILAGVLLLTTACGASPDQPVNATSLSASPTAGLTQEQVTLGSLQLVDEYPLYTMRYAGSYSSRAKAPATPLPQTVLELPAETTCPARWGCSLFAALGNENNRLLGRNFDWEFSPAVLLFTDPPDGYASVSMVDIAYLGFKGDRSKNLMNLPLEQRRALLDAPALPFDGMNEEGLAVGMAAVPPGNMPRDPKKETLEELQAIREILDHAGTVDQAIEILGGHNIDMGSVPIHYLIASASGESAVVEFYNGNMVVLRNRAAWQTATNFLLASTGGHPQGQCWRYDHMSQRLEGLQGQISGPDAVGLLGDVSQESTQWSVVYHMSSGDVAVVMGRGYSKAVHTFHLRQSLP